MPGLDGSGPNGMGAMTGGGFGVCNGSTARTVGGGLGRGAGFGRGAGRGAGRGRGFARANWKNPVVQGYASVAGSVEEKLDSIISRLEALENKENN